MSAAIRGNTPASAVVVTGGASGIGEACAAALAAVNRPVAIWDIQEDKARAVAAALAERYDVPTFGLGIDLRAPAGLGDALARTRAALPALGGMVHAAGVVDQSGIDGLTQARWDAVLDVNLRAMALLVQAMLPDLRAQPGAAVVGIASINATLGNALIPAYSASKGGLLSLVRSLADSLGRDGIRINAVSPGQIHTPMPTGPPRHPRGDRAGGPFPSVGRGQLRHRHRARRRRRQHSLAALNRSALPCGYRLPVRIGTALSGASARASYQPVRPACIRASGPWRVCLTAKRCSGHG
ncbi:3-oxoacyl-[acyl-carrier-protein] reductase FabG [compost metagenome]